MEAHVRSPHLWPAGSDESLGYGARPVPPPDPRRRLLRQGTPTIVFSSSCATYGIPSELPIVESAPQRPINPYGRSKLAGEQILADARAALGLRVAMLRQRRRTRDRSCGPRPRFVWWGNNPLSLVHPTARRSRMCQLFQACRICFNMTGIRFSPKAGIPAHTVSSRMIGSAPLESGL